MYPIYFITWPGSNVMTNYSQQEVTSSYFCLNMPKAFSYNVAASVKQTLGWDNDSSMLSLTEEKKWKNHVVMWEDVAVGQRTPNLAPFWTISDSLRSIYFTILLRKYIEKRSLCILSWILREKAWYTF